MAQPSFRASEPPVRTPARPSRSVMPCAPPTAWSAAVTWPAAAGLFHLRVRRGRARGTAFLEPDLAELADGNAAGRADLIGSALQHHHRRWWPWLRHRPGLRMRRSGQQRTATEHPVAAGYGSAMQRPGRRGRPRADAVVRSPLAGGLCRWGKSGCGAASSARWPCRGAVRIDARSSSNSAARPVPRAVRSRSMVDDRSISADGGERTPSAPLSPASTGGRRRPVSSAP